MSERPAIIDNALVWLSRGEYNHLALKDYITQLEAENAKLKAIERRLKHINAKLAVDVTDNTADSKRLDKLFARCIILEKFYLEVEHTVELIEDREAIDKLEEP